MDWSAAASWAYRGGVATRAAWGRERWFPDPNCKGRTSRRQRERASHHGVRRRAPQASASARRPSALLRTIGSLSGHGVGVVDGEGDGLEGAVVEHESFEDLEPEYVPVDGNGAVRVSHGDARQMGYELQLALWNDAQGVAQSEFVPPEVAQRDLGRRDAVRRRRIATRHDRQHDATEDPVGEPRSDADGGDVPDLIDPLENDVDLGRAR